MDNIVWLVAKLTTALTKRRNPGRHSAKQAGHCADEPRIMCQPKEAHVSVNVQEGRSRRWGRRGKVSPPETWQPQPQARSTYYPPAPWERPAMPEGEEPQFVRPYVAALGNRGESR
jgi:hypothetical protein